MNRTHFLRNLGFSSALDSFINNIPALSAVSGFASLQFIVEQWQGDRVLIRGEIQLETRNAVDILGVKMVFGDVVGESIRIPFVIDTAALPIYTVLLALSVHKGYLAAEDVAEILAEEDLQDPDDLFLQFETDFAAITLTFGPVPINLVFGDDFLTVGRHLNDSNGQAIAVEPNPDAGSVRLPLGEATVTASSNGLDFVIESPDSLTLPPLMLEGTGLALELKGLTVKLSEGQLPASVAALGADKGFDESWRGLYADEVTIWNLDKVFPGGPASDASESEHAHITASSFAIDSRGLTGSIAWQQTPPGEEVLSLETVEIEFDRAWYPLTARASGELNLDTYNGGTIGYESGLELNPFASADDRWRLMLALTDLSPGEPIVAIDNPPSATAGAMVAAVAALGDGDLALLIAALAAGKEADILNWNNLSLDQAVIESQLRADGYMLKARLVFEIDAEVDIVDDPIPLMLGASDMVVEYDTESGFSSNWTLSDGLDLTLPMDVDIGGQVTLEKISLRRREDNALVIEIGVEQDGAGDVAIGGLPNVISLVYQPGPPESFDVELSRDGQELTLLVPGVLYAKGSLQRSDETFPAVGDLTWSNTLRAALTAYLVGDGSANTPEDHLKKANYLFALDFGLLTSTRSDGLKALVLSGDLSFKPGIPVGATGTALYGIGLTYAQNATPDTVDADYPDWFLRTDPIYTTHASKWVPKGDNWGFGASVSLGSQPDDGKSWNVTAGLFLLLPGPVIGITGKGMLFSPPPDLPTGGQGRSVEAPFAAAISLDFHNDKLKAELTGDIEVAAGGASLLELHVPAKVDASLSAPLDMSLSVGQYKPVDARVVGKALGLYEITCYVMATTEGIDDFPRQGIHLPGFAMAYGGSGGLTAGFSSAIAELKLSVQAGYDLGVSLSNPPMMVGQLFIDGSLVARLVCLMLNMGIRTDLLVVAPDPFELSGNIRIRVDLPWPIPDIKFSGGFRLGKETSWPDDYHYPENPVSDISLFPRPNGASQLASGDNFDGKVINDGGTVDGVPVDAGILVAFRTSVGNEAPVIGDVETQADDTANPVWEIASTGQTDDGRQIRVGWRHIVTGIKIKEAGQSITVKGGWCFKGIAGTTPDSDNQAAGGQAVRNTISVMTALDAPVERRYGTGAEVLGKIIEGWKPCETVPSPKELIASHTVPDPETFGIERFHARSPAHLVADRWYRLQRHAPESGPYIRVSYVSPAPGNQLFFPNYELLRSMILRRPTAFNFKVDEPIRSQKFLLAIPTAVFARDNEAQQASAASASMLPPAGTLQLHIPGAGKNRFMYFAVRKGVILDLRDDNGDELEVTDIFNSRLVIDEGEIWEVKRLSLPVTELTVNASAMQSKSVDNGTLGFYGALLLGANWFMDFELRQGAAQRKQEATTEMITDLGEQSAAWAQGQADGLMKPDTEYEIEVTVQTHHARQFDNGPLEVASDAKTFTHQARFRTETDIKQPLTSRSEAPVWAGDVVSPWMVDTSPVNDHFHYRENSLNVHFSDALVSGRLAAHKRSTMLKLTHESGRSFQEHADALLAEKKKDFSELQDIVSEYLENQPCLNGQDPLWLQLNHRFDTLLEPGKYVAELQAIDNNNQRDPAVLHQWRFRASRWLNLRDHVRAYSVQIEPQLGDAAAALHATQQRLGSVPVFERDDMLLDALIYEDIGARPRETASLPEVRLRIYQDGICAVLLDGPEPLLKKSMNVTLEREGQTIPIPAIVSNVAETRSLLCLDQVLGQGPLTLQITHDGRKHDIHINIPNLEDLLEAL